MSCAKYLTLSQCSKTELYTVDKAGAPIFPKQFLPLWSMLSYISEYSLNPLIIIPGELYLPYIPPMYPTSTLTSVGFLTSETSDVKIAIFDNDQKEGPITNSGPLLTTYDDGPDFSISWSVSSKVSVSYTH